MWELFLTKICEFVFKQSWDQSWSRFITRREVRRDIFLPPLLFSCSCITHCPAWAWPSAGLRDMDCYDTGAASSSSSWDLSSLKKKNNKNINAIKGQRGKEIHQHFLNLPTKPTGAGSLTTAWQAKWSIWLQIREHLRFSSLRNAFMFLKAVAVNDVWIRRVIKK